MMFKACSLAAVMMCVTISPACATLKKQTVFKSTSPLLVKNDATSGESEIAFPILKPKPGKTVCLSFKAHLEYERGSGGWNNYLGIKINGRQLDANTQAGTPRLLNRGSSLQVMYSGKRKVISWWQKRSGIPCLRVFISDGNVKAVMNNVLSHKDAGFEYLLDISDMVESTDGKGKLNNLEFINTLSEEINKKYFKSRIAGMSVKDIQICYVDSKEISRMVNATLWESAPVYTPYRVSQSEKKKQNEIPCIEKDSEGKTIIRSGPFAVHQGKELHVTYNGQVFIESDTLTPLKSLEDAESIRIDKTKDAFAVNVIQEKNDAFKFRKEVAVRRDGAIELTVKTDYASYKSDFFRKYSFKIPFKMLEGAFYTVREGAYTWNWDTKGKITADTPNGKLASTWRTRFIAFEKQGLKIVLDGNPLGPRQCSDYPIGGEPMTCWVIARSGDYIEFSTLLRTAKSAGGIFAAKMLIYEGEYDYKEKHPLQVCSVYAAGKTNRPAAHFAFGTVRTTAGIVTKKVGTVNASPVIPSNTSIYTEEKGCGWRNGRRIAVLETHPTNVYRNGVVAAKGGDDTFAFDIRPAYYVVTVHVGHPEKNIGPFNVSLNGKVIARNVVVHAGKNKAIFGSHYLRRPEKQLRVGFSGRSRWAVNKIAAQAVIYPNEDYVFDRKLWVVPDLYEPDISIDTSYTTTSEQWSPKAESEDELDWRWDMRMTSWSQANASTAEFNTPQLCDRQAREIKESGYNTVNYGIYFWQLAYTHRWDEVIAQTKMVVDACHKYGLKVIYHPDVPVIIYGGTGLEYMIRHANWGTRDIRYDISSLQKVCWNNPDFREEFFTRVVELIEKTGLDGGMFDEVYYDDAEYCGCEHCRNDFTKETGLKLPRDPASTVFLNPDDTIWMQWLKWRKQSYGKWFKALRETLGKANPNFITMVYGNESDLINGYRANVRGLSMFDAAKWARFVGTEIDLRNPMDNYRHIGATRKIVSAIGNCYGNPIWGLITNTSDPNILYFGWAMNHMNRQVSWIYLVKGGERYIDWSDQMQGRYAKSMADTAVLCSISLRDTNMKDSQGADMHGYSQCMTDAHIMHDFILEDDLKPEKLKGYKRLIIASTETLSDEHAEAIRKFVADGGALLVSGYAGLADENYESVENSQLADVMGVDCGPAAGFGDGSLRIQFKTDATSTVFTKPVRRVTLRDSADAEVLADVVAGNKSQVIPAVVVNRYKKGKCIYVAPQLGRAVYDPGCHTGCKWAYKKNQEIADVLIKVVNLAGQDKQFLLRAVDVPQKVLMTVYRSQSEKDGEQLLVHILNATGATDFKKGDVVPMTKTGVAFPRIKKDIVIDLKEPVQSGYVVSPDYQGKRPIKIQKQADGYTRIILSKNDLQAYSIIYLTNEKPR